MTTRTAPDKPSILKLQPRNIPEKLKGRMQWICWKLQWDGKKWKKPPVDVNGQCVDCTDPQNWLTFSDAEAALSRRRVDGIGFVLTEQTKITAIDLDDCRNPGTGVLKPWARDIVDEVDSYTELSPLGEGLHIYAWSTLPGPGHNQGGIELYDRLHYMTVTGWHLSGTPRLIEKRRSRIVPLYRRAFGHEKANPHANTQDASHQLTGDDLALIARVTHDCGNTFTLLWDGHNTSHPSQSEGDMALCGYLARFTTDGKQIDRLFRSSGRMRPKWDEMHGKTTYGQRTIGMALSNRAESSFSPSFHPVDIGTLLNEVEEEIPWIVHGYLGRGLLTLLGGLPKIGKTTLAYCIARCVATGKPALNRATERVRVLIVAAEEHKRDAVNRFRINSSHLEGRIAIHSGAPPFTAQHIDEMVRYINQNRIGLILIDTLHAWWNVADENSSAKVLEAGRLINPAVRSTRAAWLCIVHSRKTGGQSGSDIRGSNALVGLADISVSLKDRNNGQRLLEPSTRYRETPGDLILEYRNNDYEVLGTKEEISLAAQIIQIRSVLNVWQTSASIEKLTNLGKVAVYRCLQKMADSVDRKGKGVKGDPFWFRLKKVS
jgi:hypothetical protein